MSEVSSIQQTLSVSNTCNPNYAKKYCPALSPPKSTPRHSHLKAPAAVKHMAAYTGGLLSISEKEERKHGEKLRKHRKLTRNDQYKRTDSEDESDVDHVKTALWAINKDDQKLEKTG